MVTRCSSCGSLFDKKLIPLGDSLREGKSKLDHDKQKTFDKIFTAATAHYSIGPVLSDNTTSSRAEDDLGQSPDLKQPEICSRCHSLKHHSRLPDHEWKSRGEDENEFDTYHSIREDHKSVVINTIDIMDFPLPILALKQHLGHRRTILTVYNKVDILLRRPTSLCKLVKRLNRFHDLQTEEIYAVSATKGWGMQHLIDRLRQRPKNTNIYFIGAANAGKSSLINALATLANTKSGTPLSSHIPGTTLFPIPIEDSQLHKLLGSGTLYDLPGVRAHGLWQFMQNQDLRQNLPHRLMKPRPISLGVGWSLSIGDIVEIDYLEGDCHILLTPYVHIKVLKKRITAKTMRETADSDKHDALLLESFTETFSKDGRTRFNVCDLVFKDLGFLSLHLWRGTARLRISTPDGRHAIVREPSLVDNSYQIH